jgi:hypothetical protein
MNGTRFVQVDDKIINLGLVQMVTVSPAYDRWPLTVYVYFDYSAAEGRTQLEGDKGERFLAALEKIGVYVA